MDGRCFCLWKPAHCDGRDLQNLYERWNRVFAGDDICRAIVVINKNNELDGYVRYNFGMTLKDIKRRHDGLGIDCTPKNRKYTDAHYLDIILPTNGMYEPMVYGYPPPEPSRRQKNPTGGRQHQRNEERPSVRRSSGESSPVNSSTKKIRDLAVKLWKDKCYRMTDDEELLYLHHGSAIRNLVSQKNRRLVKTADEILGEPKQTVPWGSGAVGFTPKIPAIPLLDGGVFTNAETVELDLIEPSDNTFRFFLSPRVEYKSKPERKQPGDVGYDVAALTDGSIPPMKTKKIATGVYIISPLGFYMEVKDRSGVSSKGRMVVGGVVDNHYRGELFVSIFNGSLTETWEYFAGDRIAQLVPRLMHDNIRTEYYLADDETILKLAQSTDRGGHGFGSTGV
ncbi:hypothetical protein V1264_004985 [Littorina saxatilis]|uniref:Deoxyuridine 5'-triphosphate nucleotidohydrolase n=1 Tax=Littorina saxatilis TaxID=31220 RepID=A0AAN9B2N7_9CAEN